MTFDIRLASIQLTALAASVMFIIGLKRLSSPATARSGNSLAIWGMILAVGFTLLDPRIIPSQFLPMLVAFVIGAVPAYWLSKRVQMTAMPQMVAFFNGMGGGAASLVSVAGFLELLQKGEATESPITILLGTIIGAITLSGSIIAFAKLQGLISSKPLTYAGQKIVNGLLWLAVVGAGTTVMVLTSQAVPVQAGGSGFSPLLEPVFLGALGGAVLIGILMVLPIGGADMPVVISLLNSFTGLACAFTGFAVHSYVLVISGALVGASGTLLTMLMCKAMNRPLTNVLFGAFGSVVTAGAGAVAQGTDGSVREITVEDLAPLLAYARSVIVVPGYGLAVAQAQHTVRELSELLETKGVEVKFAIHPVAGRMPGHMNVLLAEADVPYPQLYDMEDINPEFEKADVALVIGANDVTNPAARSDTSSPIYGMPILDVDKAKNVVVLKRSMSPGFAGIDNALYLQDNTRMLFGDAHKMLAKLVTEVKSSEAVPLPADWIQQARGMDVLQQVLQEAQSSGVRIWLVGGAIRDGLLNKPLLDLDFALDGDGCQTARRVAKRVNGAYVPLDEVRRMARVVPLRGGPVLDFSSLVGDSITSDLMQRDLTVNAMAVDLGELLQVEQSAVPSVIDPTGGERDLLVDHWARDPAEDVVKDDPLRCLRLFRFACTLSLSIDPESRTWVTTHAIRLKSVSPERVRDELFKILAAPHCIEVVREMDRARVLEVLFPHILPCRGLSQGNHHHLDVWDHSLFTLEMLEKTMQDADTIFGDRGPEVKVHLASATVEGRSRGTLLKFAALFHDIGKPSTCQVEKGKNQFPEHDRAGGVMIEDVALGLRLSTRETRTLCRIVGNHLMPLTLEEPVQAASIAAMFARVQDDALDLLLLSLGDSAAAQGPSNSPEARAAHQKKVLRLMDWMDRWREAGRHPLLNGGDVMQLTGEGAGPSVGSLLQDLRVAQMEGLLKTRADAEAYVRARAEESQ